jgi:S1-C subfamily serine protease
MVMERFQKWIGVLVLAAWGYFAYARHKAPAPVVHFADTLNLEAQPALFQRGAAIQMPSYSTTLESQIPSELLVVRAQPAVYRILVYGNTELTVPQRITVRTNELRSEWNLVGTLGTEEERISYFWSRIIADPEKYLVVSNQTNVRKQTDALMGSATGFMVSKEGIVVTNAHVISDCDPEPVPADPEVMISLLGDEVDAWMTELPKVVGGTVREAQEKDLAIALLQWLRQHSQIQGKFTRCTLALQLATKALSTTQLLTMSTDEFLRRPKVTIEAPLTVLSVGQPMPGKDIAILRASAGGWDPVGRSVCLPLGDSDDVLPGTRVQAMGFPGVAFNSALMRPEAEYRCSVQDGQIANTKPMTGDWQAFEMTADINHGDSGGPVLDQGGRVIAINVGSAQGASSHTLAVPINLVKRMLDDLNIKPDAGSATAIWLNALGAYSKGDYQSADKLLDGLRELQSGQRGVDGRSSMSSISIMTLTSEKVNPYVNEMAGRALVKMRK